MTKKATAFIIKLCIVIALFVLIFRPETFGLEGLFGDVAPLDVWRTLREVSTAGPAMFFFWMACATAVKLLGISAGIVRWRLLLGGQGLRIPGLYLVYQWFMGRTIGLVLPGTLGLDGYRLVESSRYTREPVKCATVIAVEKLTGIIALSFLVFMTFPLGFKYFQFNVALLALIMACLFGGVVGSLLLLLNPRVIQIMIAVIPVPPVARGIINKLGQAATAYSSHKGVLLTALCFGLLVHLGTCSKYFFTFLAIRATGVSVADIFFVSPLMITASVLAFTISGLGVREVAFGLVLGSATGHAVAILGGHLGLWAGEIVPFILSVPLLLFGGRPDRETLESDRSRIAEEIQAAAPPMSALLTREEVRRYRREVAGMIAAGAVTGILAGCLIAVLESAWILMQLPGLPTWGMFPWGVIAYGVIFGGVGLGIAGGLLFLSLLFDRFPPWSATVGLVYAATFAVGAFVISVFRYQRDVLDGHAMTSRELGMLVTLVCGTALILGVVAFVKAEFFRKRFRFTVPRLAAACLAGWAVWFGVTAGVAAWMAPGTPPAHFAPETANDGPNILLCTIDALRADYLRLYNPDAAAHTPNLDAFAEDSVLFYHAFSQASWTKPSYGTMFTGLYPTAHGATTKTAVLSPEVETVAGLLGRSGYFSKGFSNNPNMTRAFGMHQGFTEYTELKPSLLFAAPDSAVHLSMYNVLRRVFMMVEGRLRGGRLRITDYYQPAEVITKTTLDWLDSEEALDNAPFFLYLHYMDTHDPFMNHDEPGIGYARARKEHPDPERYKEPMKEAYISEIVYLDYHLGALFDGLKERGLYDNTVIVFVSDHGEEFYDHGGWWHGMTLYEEQLRVPLLIKLPDGLHGGVANYDIARLVDIAPTMLHFASVSGGEEMSGQTLYDLAGVFTNATITYSFAENDFEGNLQQAVRSLDAALILANEDNPRGVAPVEFYDMRDDPGQQENLADAPEYADVMAQLKEVIDRYWQMILENAPEPTDADAIDPYLQQQLEALGYL